jgi:hypothetical protein
MLFEKSLVGTTDTHVVRAASLVEEYYHRFDAWVSFLCVFDAENACLDYRLRNVPAIQDMIIRLLEILRRNVFQRE